MNYCDTCEYAEKAILDQINSDIRSVVITSIITGLFCSAMYEGTDRSIVAPFLIFIFVGSYVLSVGKTYLKPITAQRYYVQFPPFDLLSRFLFLYSAISLATGIFILEYSEYVNGFAYSHRFFVEHFSWPLLIALLFLEGFFCNILTKRAYKQWVEAYIHSNIDLINN